MFQFQKSECVLFALVLCSCMLCNVVTSREIRLNPNRKVGVDNATCLEGISSVPCQSLEFIAEGVQNNCSNVTIWIEATRVDLSKELKFHNCYNLSIMAGQPIRVRCPTYRHNRKIKYYGFQFENITGLRMKNLNILFCQSSFHNLSSTAAIQIFDSRDVTLENVNIIQSRTTAVVFFDTFGTVSLIDSSFKHNRLFGTSQQTYSYPGGVYIEFQKNETGAAYTFTNCSFIGNRAPDRFMKYNKSNFVPTGDWRGLGLGGGLAILFTYNSSWVNVSILNCNFTANSAKWGGGMYVHYQGNAVHNTVLINNTNFVRNKAQTEGGGMDVGFLQVLPSHNRLLLTNCKFYNNIADTTGGISLFSVHGNTKPIPGESVIFQNCTWANNIARSSAAINIGPSHFDRLNQGFLPILLFKDCNFSGNMLYNWRRPLDYPTVVLPNRTVTTSQYSGVFTITKGTAVFQGLTIFNDNRFTALHATSSRVVFEKQSTVEFQNNIGSKGAAIAMYGFSTLIFSEDSSFEFTNNSATSTGGAIYYETFDQHDFNLARKCFLQYDGTKWAVEDRNITFTFSGNTAKAGSSIYSTSLFPCYFEWFEKFESVSQLADIFKILATFTFDEDYNNSLATDGREFKLEANFTDRVSTIPGKELTVPLTFLDEFGQARKTAYALSVKTNASAGIRINPEYTVDPSTSFCGHPFENYTFLVSTHRVRRVSAVIQMTFLPCPPGFYYNNVSMSCKCAADNPAKAFTGMTRCNYTAYYAKIQYGFWGGYDSSNIFFTALCPLTFCALTTNASNPRHQHALPNSSSALNNAMCGKSRKGILCGECQQNNSVYYHSSHFECKPNRLCKAGFLFYIFSELTPTVILFSVIIAIDISFTQGSMNGFILFSQVLDTITLNMRLSNERMEQTTLFLKTFYGIFSLNFLDFEPLSFCLWEGATVMDILTFKYVTVVFALLLVIGLIVLMNSRLCTKSHQKANQKLSGVHGLSAFLVICYTQCTKISFYILTRVVLEGEGGTTGPIVTFFGGIPYFKGKHLLYVFPAIFCLVTITILPPLLLFLYPLLYQLLGLCGLSEHYIVTKLSNVFCIHKIMPIFDSFQSCYKDKLRFFAGLYFMYRIVILAAYSISKNIAQFHIVISFLLLILMGTHSLVQPYKKISHNCIDSLLFLNLTLINALMVLSIVFEIESTETPSYVNQNATLTFISTFAMILILLPLATFACWISFKTIRKCITCFRKRQNGTLSLGTSTTVENTNLDDLLVTRDLGENDDSIDGQYFELADYENQQQNTY